MRGLLALDLMPIRHPRIPHHPQHTHHELITICPAPSRHSSMCFRFPSPKIRTRSTRTRFSSLVRHFGLQLQPTSKTFYSPLHSAQSWSLKPELRNVRTFTVVVYLSRPTQPRVTSYLVSEIYPLSPINSGQQSHGGAHPKSGPARTISRTLHGTIYYNNPQRSPSHWPGAPYISVNFSHFI